MFRVTSGRCRTVFVPILISVGVIIVWALQVPGRSVDHDSQAGVVPTQRRDGSGVVVIAFGGGVYGISGGGG